MKKIFLLLLTLTISTSRLFAVGREEGAIRTQPDRSHYHYENHYDYGTHTEAVKNFEPQTVEPKKTPKSKSLIHELAEYEVKQAAGIYSVSWVSAFCHELAHLGAQGLIFGPKTVAGIFVGCRPTRIDYQKMISEKFVANFALNPLNGGAACRRLIPRYSNLPKSIRKMGHVIQNGSGPMGGVGASLLMLNQLTKYEKDNDISAIQNIPIKIFCIIEALNHYANLFSEKKGSMDGTKIRLILGMKPLKYNTAIAGLGLTALTGWIYGKTTNKK